jgi:hypothetical protein
MEIEIVDGSQPEKMLGAIRAYKVYKIRRKSTGLFSSGGSSVSWSKNGKTWSTLAGVSGHLAMFIGRQYTSSWHHSQVLWNDVEIVVYEVKESPVENIPAEEYMAGLCERSERRKMKAEARKAKRVMESAQAEFERAKARLESLK